MKPADVALAVMVMALWGFNFGVAKWGLAELPPLFLMMLRFCLAAAMVIPFVGIPRGHLKEIAALSFTLGFLHFALMFTGLAGIDASTAAIAVQIQVPFAAILAAIFFKDRLGWRRAIGMVLGFVGVAILAGEPESAGNPVALACVIAAAMVWAGASIQIKKIRGVDGLALNGWMALFAAPQLAIGSLILEQGQFEALAEASWRVYFSITYMAVCVVIIGYALWTRLLARYDVNQAMPFTLLAPIFGVLTGILMLGESLTAAKLIGGALTICGVAIIVIRRPQSAVPRGPRG